MSEMQPNREQVTELRKNPTVKAWIKEYQSEGWSKNRTCQSCGWPHNSYVACGMGATFGSVRLGGNEYFIDGSNIEFMLKFVQSLGVGFHWKDEIFFNVADDAVIIRHLQPYNNTPQVKDWKIPLAEWDSITRFVQERRPCNCGADRTGPSAEAHLDTCPQR